MIQLSFRTFSFLNISNEKEMDLNFLSQKEIHFQLFIKFAFDLTKVGCILDSPGICKETLLKGSRERKLRRQRIVYRHNGDTEVLCPGTQVDLEK